MGKKEHAHNWTGGRVIASNGYIIIFVGKNHHLADIRGYAYEHRLVAEKMLDRRLKDGEQVHHKDENKQNNSPSNLEVMASFAVHRSAHRKPGSRLRLPDEENPTLVCTCGCGEKFQKFDAAGRPRKYVSGHNPHGAPTETAILSLLSGKTLHREEIAYLLKKRIAVVAQALSKMKKKGILEQKSRGWYGIRETKQLPLRKEASDG